MPVNEFRHRVTIAPADNDYVMFGDSRGFEVPARHWVSDSPGPAGSPIGPLHHLCHAPERRCVATLGSARRAWLSPYGRARLRARPQGAVGRGARGASWSPRRGAGRDRRRGLELVRSLSPFPVRGAAVKGGSRPERYLAAVSSLGRQASKRSALVRS